MTEEVEMCRSYKNAFVGVAYLNIGLFKKFRS